MKRGVSGKRNEFAVLFQPEIGDSKAQVINRLEVMLAELKKWEKKGYEHASASCTEATEINGEMRGGWISPKTWTCSLCGFYVGSIREDVAQLHMMLDKLREAPEDWKFGVKTN